MQKPGNVKTVIDKRSHADFLSFNQTNISIVFVTNKLRYMKMCHACFMFEYIP